jgi:hypothetical protein
MRYHAMISWFSGASFLFLAVTASFEFEVDCLFASSAMGHCLSHVAPVQECDNIALQVRDGYDVLIKCTPYPAWRLLMDYLQDDRAFCHCMIPHFHKLGDITVLIARKEPAYYRHFDTEQ